MLAFVLLLILIAVVLGFLGVLLKGLFWLLIIGCVVFVVALVITAVKVRSGRRGPKA